MTLVNAETGEIVAQCSPEEARRITDAIRASAEALWKLLAEAHDKGAWSAMGYATFKAYVDAEFGMSEVHAYRLLNQARVIEALSAGDGLTNWLVPSESQARALAPLKDEPDKMARVWKSTVERTEGKPTAKAISEAVADAVREQREQLAQKAEDRSAIADLTENARAAGLDMDDDRMRQRGEFARLCKDIAKLPDPATFIERQGGYLRERHGEYAIDAHAWLDKFVNEWRNR